MKHTLARLFKEAAPLREWRYTCIRLYTPPEDLLFTSKTPEQLTTNPVRCPGDTRKYCTAPAIRCYEFGVEVIVVPLAPGLLARGLVVPSAPELPAILVMFSALRKPDTSVWDDSSTDCLLARLVVAALGTGSLGCGDRLSQAKPGAGCTTMCTRTSSRLASGRRGVAGRDTGDCAATAPA